jgi:hypothetical protein
MPNISDVSIKMRHLRSTILQIAAKLGTARANARHAASVSVGDPSRGDQLHSPRR